jgi:antirestriction protein
VGERSEEALARFEDHYLGQFESTESCVENMLEESDAYSFEEFVLPEWLKPYVKIDVELLARDTEIELYVVESRESYWKLGSLSASHQERGGPSFQ